MSTTLKTATELTTQPYAQQLEALRIEFTRAQAMVTNVITELELELERMRNSEKVPHDLVVKKDLQIEHLVRFNNSIDDLFNVYKLLVINQRSQLVATNMMLWDALKSQQTAFEVLMHRLVKTPKQ